MLHIILNTSRNKILKVQKGCDLRWKIQRGIKSKESSKYGQKLTD